MPSTVPLPERQCCICPSTFTPRPGGYNARYCSERCRITKAPKRVYPKRPPAPSRAGKQTYYDKVIRHDPERLSIHKQQSREHQERNRKWLADYKTSRGCVDCGYKQHAAALQLDHTGTKTAAISQIRTSIKRMQAEIEAGECVVRCANCHAVKTWRDQQRPDGSRI